MLKLTSKQKDLIELINTKQKELGTTLYFRYFNNSLGMCIIKLIENNTKCEVVESKINTKIVYTLLDKGVLGESKINENLKMVTLVQ